MSFWRTFFWMKWEILLNFVLFDLFFISILFQVTGEAQYLDDVPPPAGTLHGALVLSTVPHAEILSVNCEDAGTVPGFVRYFGAEDVPGQLQVGAVLHDEEAFASKKVTAVGQVIGVVVGETLESARLAARKVQVKYREISPAILSIEESILAENFLDFPPNMVKERVAEKGDVEAIFSREPLGECQVASGEIKIGGQEHFYLEPQGSLVWIVDGGKEVHVLSSTQVNVLLVEKFPFFSSMKYTKRN